ncbi:MAG TPA: TonB-dependent receptor [Steroidobacteraceae bacterium]|nr:TonB-dependent receptor [Steroidobacteraceae bacterium]
MKKQVSCAAAVAALLAPILAHAADVSGAAGDALQEIVVTAERRAEPLQDVPISITAFSAEDLERSNINYAKDYLQLTPNVSYAQDGQTGSNSIRVSIRGVSNVSLSERAVPNSIGYYLDEFNVGTVAAGTINPNMVDVQRVEVLRGPQGTYFGRNATGGALNISTNLPDNHWFAEVSGYGGNYDSWGGHLIANAPVSDTLFLRGAISYDSSSGIVKNVNPNGTANSGFDTTNLRLAARWLASEKFTADLSFMYMNDMEGIDPDVNTGVLDLDTISIEGPDFRPIDDQLGFYPNNKDRVNHSRPEWNRNELHGENLRLAYDFGNMVLKSITGNLNTHNSRSFDEDATSPDTIYRRNEWNAQSWSEELRLQNKTGTAFDWVVGAIYAHDKVQQYNLVALGTEFTYTYPDTGETVFLAPPFPDLPVNENNAQYIDKSSAAYAEATWHASEKWAFTLGGRYTHDSINDQITGLVAFGTPQADLFGSSSYNDFSPRLVATFKPAADTMLYATISHGYKAGGNNLNAALPEQNKPYAPEKVWNYEVGYKSEWWDHKAILNASVFYLDWKDLQAEVGYLAVPGDISSAVNITENASSAKSKGAELEAQMRPIKELTLGLGVGYLDATFGSFPDAVVYGVTVDLSGRPLPQSPKWTGSATAEWSQPVGSNGSNWYIRWDEVYRSSSYSNLEGVAAEPVGLSSYPFLMPEFWVANIHAGFNFGASMTLEGSVNNVFERDYYTGTGDHFGFGGVRITPNPMIWRVQATYRFK